MKKLFISATTTFALSVGVLAAGGGGDNYFVDHDFSFEGPFGAFDEFQLQRGLQVFTEVCSACHGISHVGFYELDNEGGPNLPEAQVRAFAEKFDVWDDAQRDFRGATYADSFPEGSLESAPDLSLMAKARAGFHGPYGLGINQILKGMGGAEHIYSVLIAYPSVNPEIAETAHANDEGVPECAKDFATDLHYNAAFSGGAYPESCKEFDEQGHEIGRKVPGSWFGMTPPLFDGQVTYADGSPETVQQYAADVSAFLAWTAEPNMNHRKLFGATITLMLAFLTLVLWFANKLLWAPIKRGDE